MKTILLNDQGQMPALGLGTWKSAPGEVAGAVRVALEAGYRHVDCAAIYGNEAEVGEALGAALKGGQVSREGLWVTSKLWNNAHEPERVRPALEATLGALGLDHLDLYLIHWPIALRAGVQFPSGADDFIPIEAAPLEATWEAMVALREAGLTRHIGVSNFTAAHVDRVHEATGVMPAVNQVELHPFLQQPALLEAMKARGVAVTAYSPLGSRDRTPAMKRADEPILLEHPLVGRIAEAHDASPAQVLIAWSLARGTAVIPKSTNAGRIRENLAAADLTLSGDDMEALARLDQGFRYVSGAFWYHGGAPYTRAWLWGDA